MRCPNCHSDNPDDTFYCGKCGTKLSLAEEFPGAPTLTLQTPLKVLPPGSTIAGKYKIVGEVGRGGMGIVYKAEDTKLRRTVALKFIPPELSRYPEAKERFIREAQAAAALDHPNICTVHEVEDFEDRAFIAMAYIQGQSLREKIAKHPLGIDEALDIAIQVAEGLEEAHNKGIIHRDIKSANIMVTEKGQAKIMDFGLAKVIGESLITKEAKTMGTVAYMSPEQARGEAVDQRTDIWSLGVVLYEMLAGQLPFKGERETSIMYSIVHEEPRPLKVIKPDVPSELERIINRALEKKPESRYSSAGEMLKDLMDYQSFLQAPAVPPRGLNKFFLLLKKPQIAVPGILTLIILGFFGFRIYNRQAKIRWAKNEAIPTSRRLLDEYNSDFSSKKMRDAFNLAQKAEKYIPQDLELKELWQKVSETIIVETTPPGARVYIKAYTEANSDWAFLGIAPLEKIRVPSDYFRWKFEKEGYEPVTAASAAWEKNLARTLNKLGTIPPGMVRVTGRAAPNFGYGNLKVEDFFIDKYEVTNKQFKEFVDKGGYNKKEYWKNKFTKDGKELTWDEAMAEFVDSTGRPGPPTWQAGDYPQGQDDYPVSGISWYEAAAYAEFVGKSLPTCFDWDLATGLDLGSNIFYFPSQITPLSNFGGEGPSPVGSHQGINAFGAFDMAGNVREWCWNESEKGRCIRGGAWNDATYMYESISQAPALDRSPKNGVRCIRYIDKDKIPQKTLEPIKLGESPNFYRQRPVSDSIFQVYKEQFAYDKTGLNARVEWRNESSPDWIQEKIAFDAAYEKERVIAYLFLPQKSPPPYQTVIYFPGSGSVFQRSSKDLDKYWEFEGNLSFIVKNGRAILYPVYKGTFERGNDSLTTLEESDWNSHQYTEFFIKVVKDFKRCIDYLETRSDIDSKKLAYFGFSWGGVYGAIIPAVEDRLKASILKVGGMLVGDQGGAARPEVKPINYVTRVKIPTLMLNGKFDMIFPYEICVKPMFDLLGTPQEDKYLVLYETDHYIPQNGLIKETLRWLDKYLGPVK